MRQVLRRAKIFGVLMFICSLALAQTGTVRGAFFESDTNILFDSDEDRREIGNNGSPRNRLFYGFGATWNTSLKIGL